MAARHMAGGAFWEDPQDEQDDEPVVTHRGRHFRENLPVVEVAVAEAEPDPEPEAVVELESVPELAIEPEFELEPDSIIEFEPEFERESESEPEPTPEPDAIKEVPAVPSVSQVPVVENTAENQEARDYIDQLMRELELELFASEPRPEPKSESESVYEPEHEAEPLAELEPAVASEVEAEPVVESQLESESAPEPEPMPEPAVVSEPESELVLEEVYNIEPEPELVLEEEHEIELESELEIELPEDDGAVDELSTGANAASPTMPEPVHIPSEQDATFETLDSTLSMERIRVHSRHDTLDDTLPINRDEVRDAIRKIMPVAGETTSRLDVQQRSRPAVEGRQESVPVIRMESNEIVPRRDDKGTTRSMILRERRPFGFLAAIGEFISRLLHLDDR